MFFASGPDGDFDVLTQCGQKFHEAPNGEIPRAISHQQRNLRLLNAENPGDFRLGHAAVLKDGMDLKRELRLEQFLLRIGNAKVCKNIPTAFSHPGHWAVFPSCSPFHFSFAFLYSSVRLPLIAAGRNPSPARAS